MLTLHQGAFVQEIISILKKKEKKEIIVDGTCGTGSHSLAILENFAKDIKKLICIDIDNEILEIARQRINNFLLSLSVCPLVMYVHDNYKNTHKLLTFDGHNLMADVIILDLGVSLYHLKTKERGFGFDSEYPDMRYDKTSSPTAFEIINDLPKEEIGKILKLYAGIKNPDKFVDILKEYVNVYTHRKIGLGIYLMEKLKKKFRGKLHPATLIFQALRIYVNKELDNIESFLKTVPDILNNNGLLFIITYHSIEDRIVKNYFRNYSKLTGFSLFNKKVIKPAYPEILQNRSIRSAKLRILYRDEN